MKKDVKYLVYKDNNSAPIGYFMNNYYFEPFTSGIVHGHLDDNGFLHYYLETPNNKDEKKCGRVDGNKLTRNDGLILIIEEIN